MVKSMIAFPILLLAALGWMQERRRPMFALGSGEMTVEWTPGGEAILRLVAESERQLEQVRIFRPDGGNLIELGADTGVQHGVSGLEIELREPDLATLLANYAEGAYDIQALSVRGDLALGSARLSFDLPAAPRILHPRPGAVVHGSGLTVYWRGDGAADSYEVQLEQGDDDGLRIRLPPMQSSFRVPDRFLRPGTETSLEITAIGENGNRTVSEVLFMTHP
jgi:hypothetical protein